MKKVFKYILIGCLALFTVVQCISYVQDILFPIDRELEGKGWGIRINLIPSVFGTGDSLAEVEKQLAWEGYTKTNSKDGNVYTYKRDGKTFVCLLEKNIFVKVDENSNLVSAEGAIRERGCL